MSKNLLMDPFPTAAILGDQEYEINWDFRVGIDIMLAFEDNELADYEKQLVMLKLLYKEIIPPNLVQQAQEKAVLFLNCGEHPSGNGHENTTRLFSFDKDAKHIYGAILRTHGIDLNSVTNMHWWKFQSLFLDLDTDCFFQQILHLRRQKRDGKLTKEERQLYLKMRDILEIKAVRDEDLEKANETFMDLING